MAAAQGAGGRGKEDTVQYLIEYGESGDKERRELCIYKGVPKDVALAALGRGLGSQFKQSCSLQASSFRVAP